MSPVFIDIKPKPIANTTYDWIKGVYSMEIGHKDNTTIKFVVGNSDHYLNDFIVIKTNRLNLWCWFPIKKLDYNQIVNLPFQSQK
jgi:hypothetical protein